ncbi:conserved mitochondrial P-loop NTPase superfamily member [Andalucia godoyi]|uniref:Conserved mitochondrial P-loop NTPase superfamily member n=1 Tax=Andalucia godoyi TaxID=505711 RepID=A0A8K0AI44_ANDGO|nr:conserved mitochondrial P-loop NTPase superfamily member [Andalucia godoyi]|eukprot:ANDGO_04773.mRNA.1 conserved mitochondrial P-loop NTPase superfamily member
MFRGCVPSLLFRSVIVNSGISPGSSGAPFSVRAQSLATRGRPFGSCRVLPHIKYPVPYLLQSAVSFAMSLIPSRSLTTAEMHAAEIPHPTSISKDLFTPQYADARLTVDYTYHSVYTRDRQLLQDDIITKTLSSPPMSCSPNRNNEDETVSVAAAQSTEEVPHCVSSPWIIFTAGVMGSGKSHVLRHLSCSKLFPLDSYVLLDPDHIKDKLPEMELFKRTDSMTAGHRTHRESGYIIELLTWEAMKQSRNIIVDGSLKDWEWHADHFQRIRKDFPLYKLGILHVEASEEDVIARVSKRAKCTGRGIPLSILRHSIDQVPQSVMRLRPLVDWYARILNSSAKRIVCLDEIGSYTPCQSSLSQIKDSPS